MVNIPLLPPTTPRRPHTRYPKWLHGRCDGGGCEGRMSGSLERGSDSLLCFVMLWRSRHRAAGVSVDFSRPTPFQWLVALSGGRVTDVAQLDEGDGEVQNFSFSFKSGLCFMQRNRGRRKPLIHRDMLARFAVLPCSFLSMFTNTNAKAFWIGMWENKISPSFLKIGAQRLRH